jgi:hypothetical protein
MKMLARVVAALAFVAFATPALPCGAMKTTTADAKTDNAPVADNTSNTSTAKAKTAKPAKAETKTAQKSSTAKPVAAN